jgi:cyclohexanone monooxygenase
MNYVDDGWTEISTMLRPMSTKEMAARRSLPDGRHRRRKLVMSPKIADYRAMNVLRSAVDDVVKDPATAEALKPWYRWFCKASLLP